jgi:hypothetical protein
MFSHCQRHRRCRRGPVSHGGEPWRVESPSASRTTPPRGPATAQGGDVRAGRRGTKSASWRPGAGSPRPVQSIRDLRPPRRGAKCAHLALGIACGQQHISVDIHVHRVTNRWGYVRASTPERTMAALEARLATLLAGNQWVAGALREARLHRGASQMQHLPGAGHVPAGGGASAPLAAIEAKGSRRRHPHTGGEMSVTTQVPRDRLAEYFDEYTKRFLQNGSPEAVDVEVLERDLGDQPAVQGARLSPTTRTTTLSSSSSNPVPTGSRRRRRSGRSRSRAASSAPSRRCAPTDHGKS